MIGINTVFIENIRKIHIASQTQMWGYESSNYSIFYFITSIVGRVNVDKKVKIHLLTFFSTFQLKSSLFNLLPIYINLINNFSILK